MKVIADRDVCIAAGNCVLTAPDVFDQDEDEGTVVLLRDDPPEELREAVRRAVELCPSGAIRIAEP
ncbi:ferredoxin [Actinomadura sp. NBRC 104425]|uniref:ferredoxin n=1 Tax=Actinomadura sp. NBRC 104425 TaxID=3032204 RepID=UPI0024A1EB35|nr:ferredoxin [Actinomadura sp. NBRC 104425]GLZ13630.1 ferredoxin [Actinomadura sp. NBRC 104425]